MDVRLFRFAVFLAFLAGFSPLFGQNLRLFELQKRADSLLEAGKNEAARADFEAAFSLFRKEKSQPDSLFAVLKTGLAATFFEKNTSRADAILTDALAVLRKKAASAEPRAEIFLAFGKNAFLAKKWARADSWFEEAARLADFGGSPIQKARLNEARGNLAFAQNRFAEAEKFYLEALQKIGALGTQKAVAPPRSPTEKSRAARLFRQFALAALQKGDSRTALFALENARRFRPEEADDWRFLVIEGQAFLAVGAVDSALARAENALAVGAENGAQAAAFALIGDACTVLRDWPAAANSLGMALDLTKNEAQKGNLALKIAHAQLENRRPDAAFLALKKARAAFAADAPPSLAGLAAVVEARIFFEKKDFNAAARAVLTGLEKFKNSKNEDPATELRLLVWQAKILEKTGEKAAVLAAWQRADERLEAWLGGLSPLSRPEVESLFFEVREGLISAFLAKNEVEKAFFAADRSHAALLAERGAEPFSLENLGEKLGDETALVEYFWGAERLWAFVLEKGKKPRAIALGSVDSLAEPILDFWRLSQQNPRDVANRDSIFEAVLGRSSQLFERLVRPLDPSNLPKNVRIVPSGLLWALPFEALATRPTMAAASERSYFLRLFWLSEKTISYLPSAAFLFKKREKVATSGLFSAFRPAFGGDGRPFSPLEYSVAEVAALRSVGAFQVFENEAATVRAFRQAAAQSAILHASTHAEADGQRRDGSRLILALEADGSGGELGAQSILEMQIAAEMVVLSACQTSIGRVYRGEGAWSLARAFLQAGARSTVTTLWRVDDEATGRIVSDFYENLADGQSRAEALRRAKMAEIERENSSFWQAMPFYWSSLVLVGEAGELSEFGFSRALRVWVWPSFLFVLAVGFFWFWRRRRNF